MFFINRVQKFKYQPICLKVNMEKYLRNKVTNQLTPSYRFFLEKLRQSKTSLHVMGYESWLRHFIGYESWLWCS